MCGLRICPYPPHGRFQWGRRSQKPEFFKESMKLNWNFQMGGIFESKKKGHLVEGAMDIFGNNTLSPCFCHLF